MLRCLRAAYGTAKDPAALSFGEQRLARLILRRLRTADRAAQDAAALALRELRAARRILRHGGTRNSARRYSDENQDPLAHVVLPKRPQASPVASWRPCHGLGAR